MAGWWGHSGLEICLNESCRVSTPLGSLGLRLCGCKQSTTRAPWGWRQLKGPAMPNSRRPTPAGIVIRSPFPILASAATRVPFSIGLILRQQRKGLARRRPGSQSLREGPVAPCRLTTIAPWQDISDTPAQWTIRLLSALPYFFGAQSWTVLGSTARGTLPHDPRLFEAATSRGLDFGHHSLNKPHFPVSIIQCGG